MKTFLQFEKEAKDIYIALASSEQSSLWNGSMSFFVSLRPSDAYMRQ